MLFCSFQIAVEIQEETEREARDLVKREQDLAFELAQQVYIFKKDMWKQVAYFINIYF